MHELKPSLNSYTLSELAEHLINTYRAEQVLAALAERMEHGGVEGRLACDTNSAAQEIIRNYTTARIIRNCVAEINENFS